MLIDQSTPIHVHQPMPSSTHAEPHIPTFAHFQVIASSQVQLSLVHVWCSNLTKQHQLQEKPSTNRFHETWDTIYADRPTPTNVSTMEETTEQQGDPPTTHIKPREPIIDTDFSIDNTDQEAAIFLTSSYDYAEVVDINGCILTAKQLRRNVTDQFIIDEVISFRIHVISLNMHTTTMY